MPSLSTLPDELLLKILEECYLMEDELRTQRKPLLSLRLVSRSFHDISTPLAFDHIKLGDYNSFTPFSTICERLAKLVQLSRLVQPSPADFVRYVILTSRGTAPKDPESTDFSALEDFFDVCAGGIRGISIDSYGEGYNPGEERCSAAGDFDPRLLWKMGQIFRALPMPCLKSVSLQTGCPSFLLQLYDPVLRSPRARGSFDGLFPKAEPYGYFSAVETLRIHIGEYQNGASEDEEGLPAAVKLLTTGCAKLRCLEISKDHGRIGWTRVSWSSGIIPLNDRFDPASLRSICLRLSVVLKDTAIILGTFNRTPNLENVTLGQILIGWPNSVYREQPLGCYNWARVFEKLATMETVKAYKFERITNLDFPEDKSEIPPPPRRHPSAETVSWDWIAVCRERSDLVSYFMSEHRALESLKEVVMARRMKLGLSEEWDDGWRPAR